MPRCAACARIKAAYYAAVREGRRAAAERWCVVMGRHLREVH
ncbi:hypothetical protein ACIHFE_08550 [Streptomyces sp. NPDC052396]